jgi:hypothetical protein
LKTKTLSLSLFALTTLIGCGDPLAPSWLIDRPRVIGARIESAGDPQRPWPRPGELATVKWIVATPDGQPPMRWAFAACVPDAAGACASLLGMAAGDVAPELTFAVPSAEALGATTKLMVAGVFCAGGSPALANGEPTCQGDGAVATVVTLPVPLQRGPEENRSPDLGAAAFTFAGAPWPAGTDCAALPHVTTGEAARPITVALAGQRETFLSAANAGGVPRPRREQIQLSHFATAGKLPRQLSFVDGSDEQDPAVLSVDWTPPPTAEVPAAGLPEGGLIVRFFFVARDLRGGLDWQTRALCLTPGT